MPDTSTISLTYRGVVAHRGIAFSGETYGKTWILRLANDTWTLIDHNGNELHTFTQKDLHRKVALPGSLPGYKDLYLVGLGPQIHTFQPETEVVDALKPHIERSERANAPQFARYHRLVGLGFLGFGVLCVTCCLLPLISSLRSDFVPDSLTFTLALILIPPTLGVGVYFVVCGIRDLRQARHFARMPLV